MEGVSVGAHDYHILCAVGHKVPTFFAAHSFTAHDHAELVFAPRHHKENCVNELSSLQSSDSVDVTAVQLWLDEILHYPVHCNEQELRRKLVDK